MTPMGAQLTPLLLRATGAERGLLPRSTGSTHEMKLVRLALGSMGLNFHDADYWNWAEHERLPPAEAAAYVAEEQAKWKSYTSEDIVLYKARLHGRGPPCSQRCSRVLAAARSRTSTTRG